MYKAIFCLGFFFASLGFAQVSIHPDPNFVEDQNQSVVEENSNFDEPQLDFPVFNNGTDEFEIENAQWWRCPPNCGPQPRMWTCWVRNSVGRVFSANGRTRDIARRNAMGRCAASSHSCTLRSCR